jgi:hypothetical protein
LWAGGMCLPWLALSVWLLARDLMTRHKNAISAVALKRQLGVTYKTALAHLAPACCKPCCCAKRRFAWTTEWRSMMQIWAASSPALAWRAGRLEQGGLCGGRANRPGRQAALHALEASGRVYSQENIKAWASEHLAPTAHVLSDGLHTFCTSQANRLAQRMSAM